MALKLESLMISVQYKKTQTLISKTQKIKLLTQRISKKQKNLHQVDQMITMMMILKLEKAFKILKILSKTKKKITTI